jgi:TPR repeat protein
LHTQADALNDLGAALASGVGAPVDRAAAARLFKRAAERGHSRAAANLTDLAA